MNKLKRFKKYSLRERAEKLPYAGEYFQPDDSCYLPYEVDPYVAALEKQIERLEGDKDDLVQTIKALEKRCAVKEREVINE